jgi:hypothetical protein
LIILPDGEKSGEPKLERETVVKLNPPCIHRAAGFSLRALSKLPVDGKFFLLPTTPRLPHLKSHDVVRFFHSTIIEDQAGFVLWWQKMVKPQGGNRKSDQVPRSAHLISFEDAEELSGITHQQVSRWPNATLAWHPCRPARERTLRPLREPAPEPKEAACKLRGAGKNRQPA